MTSPAVPVSDDASGKDHPHWSGRAPQAGPLTRSINTSGNPLGMRILLGLAIAVFILCETIWAFNTGMRIRDDAFTYTRTIRFHGDIANGLHWGNLVLETAQRDIDAKQRAAARAKKLPAPAGIKVDDLTFPDLVHGVDSVYQSMYLNEPTDADYGLDYPPMRLMSMTLWARHVARQIHTVQEWPRAWHLDYDAHGDPAALASEEIAQPMLRANAYCIAATAVFAFFLVWVWSWRGGRPSLGNRTGWISWFLPQKRLVPWKPVPLSQTRGLLVFCVTASTLFYALSIAESPIPTPPPSIAYISRPVLSQTKTGAVNALISAVVSGQGNDAQYHVDWGTTPLYQNHTHDESGDGDISATIRDLPQHTLIHYRLSASNDQGVTHTDDATFSTDNAVTPSPPMRTYSAAWLDWRQWLGIGAVFGVMCAAMHYMPPVHRAWAAALVAGILVWFDPSAIVGGHVWPQWDVWVLPPFMLAALLSTLDWWFLAGIVMGVGVMFKGQTMVVGPVLILWPLLGARWGAALRILTGFVLAAGLVLSPWLLLDNTPINWTGGPMRWVLSVLAAAALSGALSLYRKPVMRRVGTVWLELKDEWNGVERDTAAASERSPRTSLFELAIFCVSLLAGIVCVTILILRRWPTDSELGITSGGLLLLLGILLPPWLLPRKAIGIWMAAILGASIWMGAYLYHGDWAWKTVGFEYGTRKHPQMALGQGGMGNLPQIMESRFGWDIGDPAFTFHLPDVADAIHLGRRAATGAMIGWPHDMGLDGSAITLDFRQFMFVIFGLLMLATAAAAAFQHRRNDPRVLAAFSGLWVMMPNVLCQMAARYQIWGAVVSATMIAISPGLTLLHFLCALLAAGMVGAQLLNYDRSRSPIIGDMMARFHPDDGWIMIMIGLIFLYVALTPGRRPPRQELDLDHA